MNTKPDYYDFNVNGTNKDLFEITQELLQDYEGANAFILGNVFKYIRRAGFKDNTKTMQDLEKALACHSLAKGALKSHK